MDGLWDSLVAGRIFSLCLLGQSENGPSRLRIDFFRIIREENPEGVVAKHRGSPYVSPLDGSRLRIALTHNPAEGRNCSSHFMLRLGSKPSVNHHPRGAGMLSKHDVENREKVLRMPIERMLSDFVKACRDSVETLIIHQDGIRGGLR